MKKYPLLYAVFLGLILPWLLFAGRETLHGDPDSSTATVPTTTAPQAQTMITVLGEDKTVQEIELECYLVGVLIGEMPSDFEPEALKAQAVVARTFAVKSIRSGYKHTDCAVCTDSSCCQDYYAPNEFLAGGGTEEQLGKFQKAVNDTAGQVLLYNGELIEATYFSCSGGRTEDAQAVWGTDVPYLQAIDSPGEEKAAHFMDTVTYSSEEFQKLLGHPLSGLPGSWIGETSYTEGGGVATVEIGEKSYTGTQLRQMLGLNSTSFVISIVGNTVTVTTKGFGHRVGMSQYGADAMAVQGKTYEQILSYYYQGTTLGSYDSV